MQFERMKLISEQLRASFDIEKGILIKACVFNGERLRTLFVTAHHLVIDGVSWRIILDDMQTILTQLLNKQPIVLPVKTSSYQAWARALEQYHSQWIREEEQYWKRMLANTFRFPADHDLEGATVLSSSTLVEQMDEILTGYSVKEANISYNTEAHDLLVTSLFRTIKEWTGKEEILIELESHGREELIDIDISMTVGWFTSIYPFSMNLRKSNISDQIKEIKEELRQVPHKGIGFGVLTYGAKSLDSQGARDIRFNYLGEFTSAPEAGFFRLQPHRLGNDSAGENRPTCAIDIQCFVVSGKLNIVLIYNAHTFLADTMRRFLHKFVFNLRSIIYHCCAKSSREFTPSDFDTVALSLEEIEGLLD